VAIMNVTQLSQIREDRRMEGIWCLLIHRRRIKLDRFLCNTYLPQHL